MKREKFFAICMILSGINILAIAAENILETSYNIINNQYLWLPFRIFSFFLSLVFLIGSSRMVRLYESRQFDIFFTLVLIGFIINTISAVFTTIASFSYDFIIFYFDLFAAYNLLHLFHQGCYLLIMILYVIAWIFLRNLIQLKYDERVVRSGSFIIISIFLVIIGLISRLIIDYFSFYVFDSPAIPIVFDVFEITAYFFTGFVIFLMGLSSIFFGFRFLKRFHIGATMQTEEPLLDHSPPKTEENLRRRKKKKMIQKERICPNCMIPIPEEMNYCPNCGNAI